MEKAEKDIGYNSLMKDAVCWRSVAVWHKALAVLQA
jgi:hypothetical protein